MNPFDEKPKSLSSTLMNWKQMSPMTYLKEDTDPYTKTRIILMNGTEYEAVKFSHNFQRHCNDNDIRRDLALIRRIEQQQQKQISGLKPINENILESTIGYEQLAVDLTCALAKRADNPNLKNTLDFALLEDFDHLYRYSNLLENDFGVHAEKLVGKYTEITPGRPTVAHHRHPHDTVKPFGTKKDSIQTIVDSHIITAAEQQTMNYYMNVGSFYINEAGKKLYTEIAMVEEDHVTEYGSLLNPNVTMLECALIHEYVECYLYYSMVLDETDENIKKIWQQCYEQELAHLHATEKLLEKYENRTYLDILPTGEFPKPLKLHSNIDYLREVLSKTAYNTGYYETFKDIKDLPEDSLFYKYQAKVNKNVEDMQSHIVIEEFIKKYGKDYRFEVAPNPLKELQDRKKDNTKVGLER